ncbi:MarR family winged helix-turn-helix transcriptional regulator [uncultured Erythrobacter sp.]|uniref:MarR family winged helix-turn-helix transcriptional regulator n=1 Tax=uncultured Erythrobacter sp. TaxID=263913 RepID=UPI0026320C51|nr:MarR family winged helix-turn-helix transcriptional regulator [uncultured Erythrobacter sp.]
MTSPKVFYLLQKAHSALFRASDGFLKEHTGLSSSQQAVLLLLRKEGDLQISVIADHLGMSRSSLSGLIDRMSAKGLVTRRPNDADGRSFEIHIEEAGLQLVGATVLDTKRMNAALLEPFSNEERETIERFLTHVAINAETIVKSNNSHPTKETAKS